MQSRNRFVAGFRRWAVAGLGVILLSTTRAGAGLIYPLGPAGDYAVLAIGGTNSFHGQIEVYQSATVITGNVGAGPFADWTHGLDCTINGALNYDTTDTLPIITGTITGGTHQMSMTDTVNAAISAEALYAALTPTQTFATLSGNQVIVGNGGLNVIRITGDVDIVGELALKKNLTLQGTAADSFIFQLTANDPTSAHQLTLSGCNMILSGGVTQGNVLWDFHGTGGGIVINSGTLAYGTFLAPGRDVLCDASTVNGALIGGGGTDANGNSMSVHSGSTVNAPEPAPTALLALGALGLTTRTRRPS